MQDRIIMLNHRQIAWLVGVVVTTGGIVSLNKSLIEIARQDAWFSEMGGILFALVVCTLFYYLSRLYPGKNLFEIHYEVAGRWGGHVLNLLCLLHYWFILIRDIAVFGDFMNTTLLVKTPSEIIIYLLVLVIIYYARSSVEVTARVNDLMFPLLYTLILALPLTLMNGIDITVLEPILGAGPSPLVKGNLMAAGWYGDILVAGAFLHTVANSQQLYSALRHGVLLAAFALTILLWLTIAVLGISVGGRTMYPTYALVQQIQITDFLDRTELFMFSIWLPSFILKMVFIMQACVLCIASMTGSNRSTLFAGQFGWFLVITTIVGFDSITEVFNFGNYGAFMIVLIGHPPIYFVLYLMARRKAKQLGLPKQQEAEKPDEPNKPMDADGKKQPWVFSWMNRGTPKRWRWICNGSLLWCLVAVAGGAILGRDYYLAGYAAGIGYALGIVLAFVASLIEMYQSNLAAKKEDLAREEEANTA